MRVLGIILVLVVMGGCVSGAPILTHEQQMRLSEIDVVMDTMSPRKQYEIISEISAADCSGARGGRLYGEDEKAIDILKAKAAAVSADAVIDVNCGTAPLLNNCWAPRKCNGTAVMWKN